jgi:uncharacterized caspase-like protein
VSQNAIRIQIATIARTRYPQGKPKMTAQPFALVDADFADGTYTFGLTWPLAAEWEKTTDRSLYATLINIMRSGFAQLQDTRELIRLGLIGGGNGSH